MANPHVSVIITTFNRSTMLVEAVESVMAQSYRDWELIVADDASTDDTAQRMAAYSNVLRYVQLPHSGKPEVARNRAVAITHGSFLAFLDDDDLWHEDKLACQMERLESDKDVGFVYSDCRILEVDGSQSPSLLSAKQKQAPDAFDVLLQGCFIYPSTVVMRRSTFERVGPFEETLACQGDYLLWLRAARAQPVACVPRPLVLLRRSPAGLSIQRRHMHVENAILALERLRQEQQLTWRQRWLSRRTLSRFHAHLGLRRQSLAAGRADLWRSLRLNPLQRTAWKALIATYLASDSRTPQRPGHAP